MKKILFILLMLPVFAKAQIIYYAPAFDSTTFTLSTSDSLIHEVRPFFGGAGPDSIIIALDTPSTTLWQMGNTLKPVFSNGILAERGIMTDTLGHYPANANSYFLLKIPHLPNCVVDFWYTLETDSVHAGGIVEFSSDSGATWMNISECRGIGTQNFYSSTDTIVSGQPAFTGISKGEQLSRFEFLNCLALKETSTKCFPDFSYTGAIYVRFRFVSDATVDTLSGWKIDSIKIEITGCGEGVSNIDNDHSLDIYPNPATTELTITAPNEITKVNITNLIGQTIFTSKYNTEKVQLDVTDLPVGVYFIKVNDTDVRKFMKE